MDDPHAERGVAGRAGQPGLPVRRRRRDLPVRDPLVAEPGAGEQRVVGVDQRLVGSAVVAQRGARPRDLGRLEVGVYVGPAERIDRLLGVGDEHERDAPFRERAIEDLPLGRVGVLELVDEHDVKPGAEPPAGGRAARPVERVVQPGEQVVVGHDREPPLALFELLANGDGQAVAHRRGAVGRLLARLELRHRVVDRRPRDPERLRPGEAGGLAAMEPPDIQIVERLVDQLGHVLDERGLAVEIADRPELGQHLLAEPVGGRDRGGVEVGDGVREAVAAQLDMRHVPRGQQGHDRVAVRVGRASEDCRQRLLASDEPLADAVAELAGRHPRERDQQQPVERRALGHVASGQRRDRVRLAGARAGLEHGHA